jgi:hypothetical protein
VHVSSVVYDDDTPLTKYFHVKKKPWFIFVGWNYVRNFGFGSSTADSKAVDYKMDLHDGNFWNKNKIVP